MSNTLITEYVDPEAPERYPKGRRCSRGFKCKAYAQMAAFGDAQPAKVRQTVEPQGTHPATGEPLVLCDQCEQERIASGDSLRRFLGLREFGKRRGRNAKGYSLKVPRLRHLREESCLKQSEVAEMVGVWTTTVTKIENGANTSEETARRFADFFGVTLDYLKGAA